MKETMNLNQHMPFEETGTLPDEWLMDYATGNLSTAYATLVASHRSFHPALQQKLSLVEDIGGDFINNASPMGLSADCLSKTLAMLDDGGADEPSDSTAYSRQNMEDFVPKALADVLDGPVADQHWRFLGPGMRYAKLWQEDSGETLWLLKAKGGTEVPIHDHRGLEMTLILKGSYCVADQRYEPGMLEMADDAVANHAPIIDEGDECICLVVTDAPIRLHSFVGRLFQPFIGL